MDTIRVIELGKLLAVGPLSTSSKFVGCADGIGAFFVEADGRLFGILLKSGQVKMLCEGNYFTVFAWFMIFQSLGHVSFC